MSNTTILITPEQLIRTENEVDVIGKIPLGEQFTALLVQYTAFIEVGV